MWQMLLIICSHNVKRECNFQQIAVIIWLVTANSIKLRSYFSKNLQSCDRKLLKVALKIQILRSVLSKVEVRLRKLQSVSWKLWSHFENCIQFLESCGHISKAVISFSKIAVTFGTFWNCQNRIVRHQECY